MAGFSFLSDSDKESAVDEILAEAMDDCVLKQVAAINLSGVSNCVLPTELENRFRRLKTFPAAKPTLGTPKSSASSVKPKSDPTDPSTKTHSTKEERSVDLGSENSNSDDKGNGNSSRSCSYESPDRKSDSRRSRRSGYVSSPSSSSNSSLENLKTPKSKAKERGRKDSGAKLRSKSFSFRSKSPNSLSRSPPRMTGCLWCSPKKSSKKKSKSNRFADLGLDWGKDNDLMADFGPYSSKEKKKLMKKAMKEEEKISREAEKIVKWAKQASARMDISDIEDELSDDDSKPHFGHH